MPRWIPGSERARHHGRRRSSLVKDAEVGRAAVTIPAPAAGKGLKMGTTTGQRFFCDCGAMIEYLEACPEETVQNPRCVCGKEFQPQTV